MKRVGKLFLIICILISFSATIVYAAAGSEKYSQLSEMTLNAVVDKNGSIKIDGVLSKPQNTNVSIAIMNTSSELVCADQVLSKKGFYESLLYPNISNGLYKIVASTPYEHQTITLDYYLAGDKELAMLKNNGLLQLSESFESNDFDIWDTRAVEIRNGAATATEGEGYKRIFTNFNSLRSSELWNDCIVTLKLSYDRVFNDTNSWIGLDLDMQDYNTAHHLYFFNTGTYVQAINSSAQLKISDFTTDLSEVYDIKIVQKNNKITAYIKNENSLQYVCLGAFDADLSRCGGIGISSMNMHFTVDNICIYNLNEDALSMNKPIVLQKGDCKKLSLIDYNNLIVTSSDSSIVKIESESGAVVKACSAGTSYVIIKSEDKEETIPVIVKNSVSDFILSADKIQLNVGNAEDLEITNGIVDSSVVWQSSNESIVSLYGRSNRNRTIVANSEGDAVISVKCKDYTKYCFVSVRDDKKIGEVPVHLKLSGQSRRVSNTIIGVHNPMAGLVNTTKTLNRNVDEEVMKEIGIQIVRGPDGGLANNYRWKTGDISSRPLEIGYPGVFLEDVYQVSNNLNIPYCFAVNVMEQNAEEILEEVKKIKTLSGGKQIYLELGNENYDMFTNPETFSQYPTPRSYIDKCGQIYYTIKEFDPSIKIGIPISVNWLERRIPGVAYINGDDSIMGWNDYVAAHSEYYDAVIPHYYSSIDDMTGFTEDEMMEALNAYNAEILRECYEHAEEFPGKEIWVTEFGVLMGELYASEDVTECNRYQITKSHGVAINEMEKVMNMMKSGHVTISALHCFASGSGFGMVQRDGDDLIKLPKFYVFKELSSIVKNFPRIFDIDLVYGESKEVNASYIYPGDIETVKNVDAWGFGTDDSITKVVISNHSSEPAKVRLDGYDMAVEWSYGGEHPLGRHYMQSNEYWYNADSSILIPDYTKYDADSEITIPEYSVVVCSLSRNLNQKAFIGLCEGDLNESINPQDGVHVYASGCMPEITVTKNGQKIESYVERSGNIYKVLADYDYNTLYQVCVTENGNNHNFEFATIKDNLVRNEFEASVEPSLSGFNIKFSENVDMENIMGIALTENGQQVDYIVNEEEDNIIITPVGGFNSGAEYKLYDRTAIISKNGSKLKSFSSTLKLPVDVSSNSSGVIANNSNGNYYLEFDLIFDGDSSDALKLNLGSNAVEFYSNGIKFIRGSEQPLPIMKYDLLKNNHISVSVGSDKQILVFVNESLTNRKVLLMSEYTDCQVAGEISVEYMGSNRVTCSQLKYDTLPQASLEIIDATKYEGLFKLSFEGAVNTDSINEESVKMFCDGKAVICDIAFAGNNCYYIYVKNISDNSIYSVTIGNNAKNIHGICLGSQSVYSNMISLRQEDVYFMSSEYDMQYGKGHELLSKFVLRNNTDSTKNVFLVQSIYNKNNTLAGIKVKNARILNFDAKSLQLRNYINVDDGEYMIKTFLIDDFGSLKPLCKPDVLE